MQSLGAEGLPRSLVRRLDLDFQPGIRLCTQPRRGLAPSVLATLRSSSSSLGSRCPLPTSASLPSRDARTQLSRLLFGIDSCFAARATDRPVASTSFTASARDSGRVSPLRCSFHLCPPIVRLHDPLDSIFPSLPHLANGCLVRIGRGPTNRGIIAPLERRSRSEVSFPRFFVFQPGGIMPPIPVHADT